MEIDCCGELATTLTHPYIFNWESNDATNGAQIHKTIPQSWGSTINQDNVWYINHATEKNLEKGRSQQQSGC